MKMKKNKKLSLDKVTISRISNPASIRGGQQNLAFARTTSATGPSPRTTSQTSENGITG